MPLANVRWGDNRAAALKAAAASNVPQDSFITDAQLKAIWEAFSAADVTEVETNADIALQASDIPVLPGTFQDSIHGPVTGVGVNSAVTLNQRIK